MRTARSHRLTKRLVNIGREDESCIIALSNLRSEVIELRNEGLEIDKILISLVSKIKEDEAKYNA